MRKSPGDKEQDAAKPEAGSAADARPGAATGNSEPDLSETAEMSKEQIKALLARKLAERAERESEETSDADSES